MVGDGNCRAFSYNRESLTWEQIVLGPLQYERVKRASGVTSIIVIDVCVEFLLFKQPLKQMFSKLFEY